MAPVIEADGRRHPLQAQPAPPPAAARHVSSGDAGPGRQARQRRAEEGGKFWALRDVSFTVQPGEAVGLVGGNGQGKSTLLKLIAGVLLPDEGGVAVHGGVAPLIELTGGFDRRPDRPRQHLADRPACTA